MPFSAEEGHIVHKEVQTWQRSMARFKSLVEANGTLAEVNEWGKRHLAYPIDHKNEGYYVLMTFDSAPTFPYELNRNFNITDGVIRSMIVDLAE